MIDPDTMAALLDSLKEPFLFDCHNPQSQAMMREVFAALEAGETERRITDKPDQRIYMRAVRDPAGRLLGYYERYERPWDVPAQA
jgi:hypothetical protein